VETRPNSLIKFSNLKKVAKYFYKRHPSHSNRIHTVEVSPVLQGYVIAYYRKDSPVSVPRFFVEEVLEINILKEE